MDIQVYLQSLEGVPEEVVELIRKKAKGKKLTTGLIKKLNVRVAEEVKSRQTKQRQDYLRETKERVQTEWDANHLRMETYEAEFQWRQSELIRSNQILSQIDDFWNERHCQLRKLKEWERYTSGTRLPNPSCVTEMNTYIYVWTELEKNDQMSDCLRKTEEVMKLLDGIEELLNYPVSDLTPKSMQGLKELRSEMRLLLQDNIDRATYRLFSRIDFDMVPINMTTSKYSAKCSHFLMSLWAELITPIPSTRGKEVRQPLKVTFEETDILVVVPVSLLDIHKVMRSMWLYYDHWTDTSRTYECPPLPEFYKYSLYQLFMMENDVKTDLMSTREKMERTLKRKIAHMPAEPTLSYELLVWNSEPQRALSEEVAYVQWEEEQDLARKIKSVLSEYEVNLRERTILGDLLVVEVLHQPPQPKCLRYKHSVTLRTEPPKLKKVDFYVHISPPDPEDLDEDTDSKRDKAKRVLLKADLSEEKKKLVTIQLRPCQTVVWFEQPQIAHWNSTHRYWSMEDIYDIYFEDDEYGTIDFKTGRLGLFALHVSRYCNLPYEDWLFESDNNNGVNFMLKTAKVDLSFNIKESEVCLARIRNVPNRALNPILGVYYTPTKLMENMKKRGLDIFPQPDAAFYLENTESKHFVIEKTIYQVWGLFSQSFRFKRSRFNQLAGKQYIVFQAQEVYPGHQVDFCLIQNSMCSSYVLDMRENDNQFYSPEPAPQMQRYVDLYGLLMRNSTLNARHLADNTSFTLIQTIKEFLELVRPLSFS